MLLMLQAWEQTLPCAAIPELAGETTSRLKVYQANQGKAPAMLGTGSHHLWRGGGGKEHEERPAAQAPSRKEGGSSPLSTREESLKCRLCEKGQCRYRQCYIPLARRPPGLVVQPVVLGPNSSDRETFHQQFLSVALGRKQQAGRCCNVFWRAERLEVTGEDLTFEILIALSLLVCVYLQVPHRSPRDLGPILINCPAPE